MYYLEPGPSSLLPQAGRIPRAEELFATGYHATLLVIYSKFLLRVQGFTQQHSLYINSKIPSEFKLSSCFCNSMEYTLNLNYPLVSAIAWSIPQGTEKAYSSESY